jgi:NDP-sugar pyrophosphorylase family protein
MANTGVYAFSPAIFEHIPAGEFYDFGKQVFPSLQNAGERFYGFDARGAYWADIGTPREYRRASFDVVRGIVRIPHAEPDGVDPSARLAPSARITGPVRMGARVWIGDGCSIVGPSVLDDDVTVEAGARLKRTILWQGATIGSGSDLRDSIVGKDYDVAPETILIDSLVANDG